MSKGDVTATPVLLRWQAGDDAATGLVLGDDGLPRLLAARLPDGRIVRSRTEPEAIMTIIAERDTLAGISDETLRQARRVILLDPTEPDHLRALRLMAGRPDARLHVLPSLETTIAAEHTMLLMLALIRQLVPAYRALLHDAQPSEPLAPATDAAVTAPNWVQMETPGWLSGKTLGIVGLGRVGRAVAERAVAFGMRVIYADRERKPVAEQRYGVVPRRFDQVLSEADIVSLHLPLTEETFRIIDAPELARMQPDAFLVNTASGRLLDEGSLIKALRDGHIAGAGLDVFAYEPIASDSPLLALDNVVLTPHIATAPPETIRADFAERATALLTLP